MQIDNNIAIASVDSHIGSYKDCVVSRRCDARIGYDIAVVACVAECLVTTNSIVASRAESVFHPQMDNHITVAAVGSDNDIGISACNGVAIAVEGEHLTGADGIVAYGVEGVFHKQTQHCSTIAAESAVACMCVVTCYGVNAVLVYVNLTGTDSIAQSIVVGGMYGNLEHLCAVATGDDTCVAVALVAGFGSAVESGIREGCVAGNSLSIDKVVTAVEQTAARVVGSCCCGIYVAGAAASAAIGYGAAAAVPAAAAAVGITSVDSVSANTEGPGIKRTSPAVSSCSNSSTCGLCTARTPTS